MLARTESMQVDPEAPPRQGGASVAFLPTFGAAGERCTETVFANRQQLLSAGTTDRRHADQLERAGAYHPAAQGSSWWYRGEEYRRGEYRRFNAQKRAEGRANRRRRRRRDRVRAG